MMSRLAALRRALRTLIATRLRRRPRRVRTPTVLQMEAVECGAAALAMVMGYYGRFEPLEALRIACGVSRDGSKATNIVKAARQYGLEAKGYRKEPEQLLDMPLPLIAFWNFNHFLVVEGFRNNKVYLNDPAAGPRVVTREEFDNAFTGVVLVITPGEDFAKGGKRASMLPALRRRLRSSETALVYVVLISLMLVIPGLIIPAFFKVFVDDVLMRGNNWLTALLVGMALTAALRAGLMWIQLVYLLRLETKLALSTSSQFFWHVLRLPAEFFTQRFSGEISSRVIINDKVARLLSGDLANNLLNIILLVFYAVLMFSYSPILTLVVILIAALNVVALQYVSRVRKDANRKLLQDKGKFLGVSIGGLQSIENLKSTGGEADYFSMWSGYHAKSLNATQQLGFPTQLLSAVPPLLTSINTTAVLGIGALLIIGGQMGSIGELVAFQTLMASFLAPITQLVMLGSKLQQVQGDLTRLDDVLSYPIDPQFSRPQAPVGDDVKLKGYVELKNISFGYSRMDAPLIENLSLSLKPGSRVALVGGSGSGKSTIARLIVGLYEPWDGEILFDGRARHDVPLRVINNSVALVEQDIYLFEGSIRDNLTLWDNTVKDSDVIQASRDASIHDDIANRPSGYDYLIEEGGRNFSGGQRQRLEIARALVSNPTVLVLDEATSALDPVVEKEVDDNLRRRGCTCIIVAHRLSTIRDADEIIVLENGKIVQRGTHDTLRSRPGTYASLIQSEESSKPNKQRSVLDKLG